MLLYKDEHMRNLHITKGKARAREYSWENATASIWKALNNIAKP